MAEWSIAAVLKTVDLRGSGGSNPSLSAGMNRKMKIFRFFCVLTPPVQACLQTGGANTKKGVQQAHRFIYARAPLAKREGMCSPLGRTQSPAASGRGNADPWGGQIPLVGNAGGPIPVCREYLTSSPRQRHAQSPSNTLLTHIICATRKENIRMARKTCAGSISSAYQACHRFGKRENIQQFLHHHPEHCTLSAPVL